MKAVIKFIPVAVLAALMIMNAFEIIEMDILTAAPIATIVAAIVAYGTEKLKFNDILDAATNSVSKILIALFILMFAYAMANSFMSTGVGAAIVNLALKLGVTGKTVAVVGVLVTGVLSIATGTSWGTFAACAPIFLWMSEIVGGNILITTAAIAGGSCFGDNIGLISDTTVVSSGIQGVEIIHRIRHQGVWSGLCLIGSAVIFFFMCLNLPGESVNGAAAIEAIPEEVWIALEAERPTAIDLLNQIQEGVAGYMVIPLILVIATAVMGMNTFICLVVGLASAYILGLFAGTTGSLLDYLQMMEDGFAEAGSWVVVMMMWVAAFGGIMGRINAFAPLSRLISNISKNVRQLMFYNGVLSLIGNACLADEMAQIVTVGPIIRELVEDNVEGSEEALYKLRLRNATFSDALGVFGSQLIPWHVYLGFYVGIASAVFPLYSFSTFDIIRYNVLAFLAVGSILILTFTGLDRFIPLFGLPKEPEVQLKKNIGKKKVS